MIKNQLPCKNQVQGAPREHNVKITPNCGCKIIISLCSSNLLSSVSLVTQSCTTLCNSMDCSTPGLPVHHQLLEFTQTHVHWVGDAIQPSHPLLSPSPPAFNLSQHRGLFQWVSSLHQVAKVMEFQLQISPSNEYSRMITFRKSNLLLNTY